MSASTILFVHAPLMGPSSFERMAESARRAGWSIALPDLTGVWDPRDPHWDQYVEAAAAAAEAQSREIVIVGHSGAGVLLPVIGHAIGERLSTLVFVDAVVPPVSGAHQTPDRLSELIDAQTIDARIARWIEWWPVDVIREILPAERDRETLSADMPRLYRDLYEQVVEMPPEWPAYRSVYLRLSDAYDEDLKKAARRGWPTSAIDGTHLSIYTDPDVVLNGVLALLK